MIFTEIFSFQIISQSSRAPAQLSLDSVGSMSTTGAAQIITTAANKISLPTQPTPRFVAQQPVVAAASTGLVTTQQQVRALTFLFFFTIC